MTVETSGDDSEIGIDMKMDTNIFGGGSSKVTNDDSDDRIKTKMLMNEYFSFLF